VLSVVIDAGHGGVERIGGSSPNNATGQLGSLEKNVTLSIALAAKNFFPSDIEVVLTREIDENLGLQTRTRVAQHHRSDAFISIHLNGWHTTNVQGTETYHYPNANKQSQNLSRLIQSEILNVTQLRNRGVKPGRLGVINPRNHLPETAACLTEVSFLTDPMEEARLLSHEYINQLGHAICTASINFLRQKYTSLAGVSRSRSTRSQTYSRSNTNIPDVEDAISLKDNSPQASSRSKSSGYKDDLTEISGIGKVRHKKLVELNVTSFKQLSKLQSTELKNCARVLGVGDEIVRKWQREAKKRV